MKYRLYLLDENAHFRAGESFSAVGDTEAAEIAAAVYNACADVFDGYELWRGTQCVLQIRNCLVPDGPITLSDVVAARQENVLDLEERLQRTFACVAASRTLLAATNGLRKR
jgi:hypothetical protein